MILEQPIYMRAVICNAHNTLENIFFIMLPDFSTMLSCFSNIKNTITDVHVFLLLLGLEGLALRPVLKYIFAKPGNSLRVQRIKLIIRPIEIIF